MKMKVILIIVSLIFIAPIVCADFVSSDKVSFDINTSGNKNNQHLNLTGIIPIKAVSGYLGIQYTYTGNLLSGIEFDVSNQLKTRLEGGYHYGHFGLRGYVRYGKDDTLLQDHLIHSGIYLHIDLIKSDTLSTDIGIGTWLEREELLPEYQNTEEDFIVSTGLRGHLQVKLNRLSVLTEFLPTHDFSEYTIRILPVYEIPVLKVFFIDQISVIVQGTIEYRSETKHINIDPWHYTWTQSLRWKF